MAPSRAPVSFPCPIPSPAAEHFQGACLPTLPLFPGDSVKHCCGPSFPSPIPLCQLPHQPGKWIGHLHSPSCPTLQFPHSPRQPCSTLLQKPVLTLCLHSLETWPNLVVSHLSSFLWTFSAPTSSPLPLLCVSPHPIPKNTSYQRLPLATMQEGFK